MIYWREKLNGAPLAVDLPGEYRPACNSSPPKPVVAQLIQKQISAEIVKLGQTEGATTFMVLMSALAIALNKWTGQADMVLGTVVAGRSSREIEGLIGCFMNFLPLRVKLAESQTGLDVLRAIRREVIESQTHQHCPYEKIVESMKVERHPGRNPLYNVALLFQDCPRGPELGAELEARPIPVHVGDALLDLRFEANENAEGIAIACEYNARLFDTMTMERLLASFQEVLEMLTQSSQTKLADFELKTELRRTHSQTIAVCGTFTTESIEDPLRFWLDELEMPGQIKFAPFDQVFQQLLDPASLLAANRAGLNVLLIRLEDWALFARRLGSRRGHPVRAGAQA